MKVQELVVQALQDIGVPVVFQIYKGTAETYVTFFCYMEQPELHADDRETIIGQYVQVDLWDKGDPRDRADSILEKLEEAGFRRISSVDLYEDGLDIYHKSMKFVLERFA